MNKVLFFGLLFISSLSFGQNFGTFASGLRVGNTIYNTSGVGVQQINPNSNAQNFDGLNLGNYGQNANCGRITAGEVKTFKTATGNVCSVSLLWRVYPSSSAPTGTFTSIPLSNLISCNAGTSIFNDGFGPCVANDQKWKDYNLNTDFTNGLTPNSYVLEVFFLLTGSDISPVTCETSKFINNSGNNFKASFTISNPNCNPVAMPTTLCEGDILTLTSNPSNGVAPYMYSWSGPNGFSSTDANPMISVTTNNSGIYSLIVTDSCGAISSSQSTQNVTVNTKIDPLFDGLNPGLCKDGNPPLLPNLSTNGIFGTWNPPTVNNQMVGTSFYTFTPNAGECANTFIQPIFVVNNVNPNFTLPTFICQGTTAPNLPATSINGVVGTWNPSIVSNTTSGSYTFTPNSGQCALVRTYSISVNPNLVPTFTLPSFVCQNGAVPLLPTTSNNGVTGTWSPSIVSNTATGNYFFTPNNPSQCSASFSRTIFVNPNVIPQFNVIAPFCENTTAPTLQTTSIDGITGTWNPATISNTASGTYTFTPSAGQCAVSTSINVVVNPKITPTFNPIPDVCYQLTPVPTLPSTSLEGITGTWNPTTISNTTSGTYTFTPNTNECALPSSITVNVLIITPTFTAIAPICNGATPLPTLPTTSNNNITGNWNPATVNNTATTTYTFTPNAGQCATTTTLSVTVTPNITPTFTAIAPFCQGTTAPILQSTSNNNISGTWNPAILSNTTSGSYTFTPNSGVCANIVTINVTVNPSINPTFTAIPVICQNGTVPALPTISNNGITGTWNPSTISNTASGSYTFTPNNPNQCGLTRIINVTVAPNVTPTFNPIPEVCFQSVPVPTLPTTSTNGITGTWNPTTISNTATTTYTFTPNAGQCAVPTTLTVNVLIITPTFSPITPICNGTTQVPILPTTSNNNITGIWNPATVNNTTTTTYTFTPNSGQCATTTTLSVTVSPNITPTFNAIAPFCSGTTAPILQSTSNNNISGTWNPATISNTTSGTYTFTPNANQCATTATLSVMVNPTITPTFNAIPLICQNGFVPTLPTTSNNGITGTWNPATINNTTSGSYTFTPNNANQCGLPLTINVNITPNVTPTFDNLPPVCIGGTVPVLPTTSNNNITGTWNPATISNTQNGTYTFTPNANQCATTFVYNVVLSPNITPTFDVIPEICYQSTVPNLQTTSNNNITGSWNPATISNTASGNYTFTPNPNQCATTVTISVTVNIINPIFDAIPPVCFADTAPILPTTSNNSITGSWNPATVSNTQSGTYTFTPNDGQCATSTTLTITVNTIIPIFTINSDICYQTSNPPSLPSTSNNSISGSWNPSIINSVTAQTYTFTPNAGQCATEYSFTTTINKITPTFDTIAPICENASTPILQATSNNGITGTWNPNVISNTTSGTYTFTPDANQCAENVSINVTVTPNVTPTFTQIADVCYNTATIPTLPTTSNNGISGTWNPSTVSNTTSQTYTFTPDIGICAVQTTMTINVNTINPMFTQIPDVCFQTSNVPNLPTTSNEGITGTWNPSIVSSTIAQIYTFTPNPGQCATTTSMTINLNSINPTFAQIPDVCFNTTNLPVLLNTSNQGITGTWNPAIVSSTIPQTYIFTPDVEQCATTTTMTININTIVPTFTNVTAICQNAIAPVLDTTSTNNITGVWNPATIDNTQSASYIFTPNADQCADVFILNFVVNPIIIPTFNDIGDICYNTTAPVLQTISNNGITGTWNPATIDNTQSGSYTFTPNTTECAVPVTINVNVIIVNPVFNLPSIICENAAVPTLATTSENGITGTWNPAMVSNTATNSYTFTPDANQCAPIVSFIINVNPIIVPNFIQIPNVCFNTTTIPSLPNTSTDGISGTWNPAIVSNTIPQTYTFTPNTGECAVPTTMNIGIFTVTTTFTQIPDVCFNTSILPTLPTTSLEGIIGTWNPSIVSSTVAQIYTFTPNDDQCATIATMTINLNTIIPQFNAIPNVCYNSAIIPVLPNLSNNGILGTWNPAIVSNTTSGIYTFTPNPEQCATVFTTAITVDTVTPFFSFATTVCQNETAPILPLVSDNTISGIWSPAVIDNVNSGTYTFTPDANQCALVISINITVNPKTTPTFTFGTSFTDCEFGLSNLLTLPLNSTENITGTWNPAIIDYTFIGTSTYTFTPDANQCALPTTLNVTITPRTVPVFTQVAPLCSNNIFIIPTTSEDGFTGTWSPQFNTNATQTYTFTPDAGQCATTTTMTIEIIQSPTGIDYTSNSVFNETLNGFIEISSVTNGTAPYLYSLDLSSFTTTTSYTQLAPGEHYLVVKDANGCQYAETITISSSCIFPKGISPNNDGKNDVLNLTSCIVADLEIFNRYGTKVNSFKNYNNQWDGTSNKGDELPDGTYYYVAKLSDGTNKTGWVYINRQTN